MPPEKNASSPERPESPASSADSPSAGGPQASRIGGKTATESRNDAQSRIGWRMGGLGMETTSQVVAGAVLGWLWDRWQGTAPTGVTIGAIAGILVGMWSLIKGALKLNRDFQKVAPPQGSVKPLPPDSDEDDWDSDREKDDWDDWKNEDSEPTDANRNPRHDASQDS